MPLKQRAEVGGFDTNAMCMILFSAKKENKISVAKDILFLNYTGFTSKHSRDRRKVHIEVLGKMHG
jgi:hypothetical protein